MAAAWLDEREPGTIFAARGMGRPLWLGAAKHELFFASTKQALVVVERYAAIRLRKREVQDGTFLALRAARVVQAERFRPDLSFVESGNLPPVRAPGESESCLQRLAVLTAAA